MITCNAQQQCGVVMIIVNGVLIEVIIMVKDVAALSHRCARCVMIIKTSLLCLTDVAMLSTSARAGRCYRQAQEPGMCCSVSLSRAVTPEQCLYESSVTLSSAVTRAVTPENIRVLKAVQFNGGISRASH